MSKEKSSSLFTQYVEACNYPGVLDVPAIQNALQKYLSALKIKRKVIQLERGWKLQELPDLVTTIQVILDATVKKTDPSSSKDFFTNSTEEEQEAFHRFATWCIQGSWWQWYEDLSYQSTIYFGAEELKKEREMEWSRPLVEAFIQGAWFLYWTESTLFWVAKPTLHYENSRSRRLHNEKGAALESDVEDLYFLHGVLVPEMVVLHPEQISIAMINEEANQELKRILIERYGLERYIKDAGLTLIQKDSYGELYQIPDSIFPIVLVTDSTPQADGVCKRYVLKATRRDCRTAHDAVASTFGLTEATYQPVHET